MVFQRSVCECEHACAVCPRVFVCVCVNVCVFVNDSNTFLSDMEARMEPMEGIIRYMSAHTLIHGLSHVLFEFILCVLCVNLFFVFCV